MKQGDRSSSPHRGRRAWLWRLVLAFWVSSIAALGVELIAVRYGVGDPGLGGAGLGLALWGLVVSPLLYLIDGGFLTFLPVVILQTEALQNGRIKWAVLLAAMAGIPLALLGWWLDWAAKVGFTVLIAAYPVAVLGMLRIEAARHGARPD